MNKNTDSDKKVFLKPSDDELRNILDPIQYEVTQKNGTEKTL